MCACVTRVRACCWRESHYISISMDVHTKGIFLSSLSDWGSFDEHRERFWKGFKCVFGNRVASF